MSYEDLLALRRQHLAVTINPQTTQLFIDESVAPYLAELFTDIHENPESMRHVLRETKKEITLQTGNPAPSRSDLTLAVVTTVLERKFQSTARDSYTLHPGDLASFICLFDYAHGVGAALDLIQCAMLELYGKTNYRELLQRDPTGTADPPQFETGSFDEYAWAQRVVAAVDKLAKDPTGFTLLDERVTEIQRDFQHSRNGAVIIAGAEGAQKVYKALYPLTEEIGSAQRENTEQEEKTEQEEEEEQQEVPPQAGEGTSRSRENLRQLRLQYKDVFIAPQAGREFTNTYITPYIAGFLQIISDKKEGLAQTFIKRKNDFPPEVRARVSLRALLCVELVTDQLENFFYNLAESRYDSQQPELFIGLFDVAQGMSRALRLLDGALGEVLGGTNYRERLKTDPAGFMREPNDEYAWAGTVVLATAVFEEDPSGFDLLDKAVAEIHEEFDNDPNGYLQIVGAESAQKVYKALYPLTEGI